MDSTIIVGLGNPGESYRKTRHNVGFMVLDLLGERWKREFKAGRGEFLWLSHAGGEKEILLIKPLTFMNLSGFAVEEALQQFGGRATEDTTASHRSSEHVRQTGFRASGAGSAGASRSREATWQILSSLRSIKMRKSR